MARIVVRQVKSIIGCSEHHRKVIKALGLGRINKVHEFDDTPSVRGMIATVAHLVVVE